MSSTGAPETVEAAPAGAVAPRRPRAWLAALLALIPGLGHLYAGHAGAAILAWLLAWVVAIVVVAGLAWGPGGAPLLLVAILAVLAVRVAIVTSAYRAARRGAPSLAVRGWRIAALCLLFVLAVSQLEDVILGWLKANWIEAFRIPSDAMAPTIANGDFLFTRPARAGEPVHRGELVVYRYSATTQFVKRVAGVAGDTLRMTDGVLHVNGRPVAEPYARHEAEPGDSGGEQGSRSEAARHRLRNWGPIVIPRDSMFVLGDNRGNSLDSRYTGYVALRDITSRPRMIYWSIEPGGAVRWSRIGRRLDVPRILP